MRMWINEFRFENEFLFSLFCVLAVLVSFILFSMVFNRRIDIIVRIFLAILMATIIFSVSNMIVRT